jgi:hypothetical protein
VHQVEGKAAEMLEGKDETSKVGVGSQPWEDEEAEREAAAGRWSPRGDWTQAGSMRSKRDVGIRTCSQVSS